MTIQKLGATSVHKHLYEATAALFVLAVPHAVVVYSLSLSSALLNLHLTAIGLVVFIGWRMEVSGTYSPESKKGSKAIPDDVLERKYADEIDDLERRLFDS